MKHAIMKNKTWLFIYLSQESEPIINLDIVFFSYSHVSNSIDKM